MKSRSVHRTGYQYLINSGGQQTMTPVPSSFIDEFSVTVDRIGDRIRPNEQAFNGSVLSPLQGIWVNQSQKFSGSGVYLQGQGLNRSAGESYPNGMNTAYNNALNSLNDKVRGTIDLSIDLAESGQTKRMIRQATKLVRYASDFYTSFRRNPLRAFGSKWLEYQYGWRPLVSTIYEAGSRLMSEAYQPYLISARGNNVYTYEAPGPVLDWDNTFRAKYTGQWSYRCEIGVYLDIRPSRLQSLAGWTSLNPVSIGWELLPFSFVVDWFIDVGGYIRSLETALIYRDLFRSGYRTDTHRNLSECKALGTSKAGTFYNLEGGIKTFSKRRYVLSGYPVQRYPSFSCDLGSTRLLSSAALLSQFLRR